MLLANNDRVTTWYEMGVYNFFKHGNVYKLLVS